MLSIFVCTAMVMSRQGGVEANTSASITYNLELSDSRGTFSKPMMRTLDNSPASMSVTDPASKKGYSLKLVPHIEPNGLISSKVALALGGVIYPEIEQETTSGKTYMILFSPPTHQTKKGVESTTFTWKTSLWPDGDLS